MALVAPMVGYSQNRELGVEPTPRSRCRRTSRSKNKRVPPSKQRMKRTFRESDAAVCFVNNRIGKDIIEAADHVKVISSHQPESPDRAVVRRSV
jgi:hypothetical protein